jgi:quercetin dioxygenase-like cupin family protein
MTTAASPNGATGRRATPTRLFVVAVLTSLAVLVTVLSLTYGASGAAQTPPKAAAAAATAASTPRVDPAQGPVVFRDADRGTWVPCEGLPGCTMRADRGDATKEASEATFRFTAGTVFAPHYHTSPEHVTGVAGIMKWTVGTTTYYVGAGDFLYYPGNAIHYGQCLPGADCLFHVFDEKPYDIHSADKPRR